MHDLGQRAPVPAVVKHGFSVAERLLLLAGLTSALVLLCAALGGP
jgi:hypothetical protein